MTPQVSIEQPMSEPARIAGVYMEPAKAFADIAARPRNWWVPLILVALASIAFVYCYSQRVGWDRMMRHEMETNTRLQSLTPEQREQAIERGIKFSGISTYVAVVVGLPVVVAIVAGALMLMMNGLMGTQVTFKQSMAIVAYSFLTGLVTAVLGIFVMYLKNPDDFDLRNPLAFNGGAFLSSTAPRWLTALASSFDVFTFWTIALMAAGYAAASRKLKWSKAFTAILLLWLVWVVAKTGWAAMVG